MKNKRKIEVNSKIEWEEIFLPKHNKVITTERTGADYILK